MRFFVGLDWGGSEHAVCVVDGDGKVVASFGATHSALGIAELLTRLAKIAPVETLPIAIERPTGLLVDSLVEAGHPVVPIHPNVLKASRPRYRSSGSKNDAGDAYMLADVLRTDGHRLHPLRPLSPEMRALRALVRGREDLLEQRIALANQLRSLLESFWPGAAALFADIDSPISLAFISKYPAPNLAARLTEKRLAGFLVAHSYSGRRSASELIERLEDAPIGRAHALEARSKGELVRSLAAVLTALVTQLGKITQAIEHQVAELEVGRVMMSFPRAGRLCAAQIVTELGEDTARFSSEEHLASEAGVTPVTYQSGKQRGVGFRYACNKRLRRAVTCFADNSRHTSQWAAGKYAAARARGCDHPHAIRVVARAWIRVIWKAWNTLTNYDSDRHAKRLDVVHA